MKTKTLSRSAQAIQDITLGRLMRQLMQQDPNLLRMYAAAEARRLMARGVTDLWKVGK